MAMRTPISEDDRPLGQIFWFLMFLGWTPILASYGYVLDPVTTIREGGPIVFAERVTLYQQTPWGHPGIGILTVSGLAATAAMFLLGWRALWPIPVFLIWSAMIWKFNAPGLGGPVEMAIHGVYSVFAFSAAWLFLRHGHLLSAGFLAYALLLLLDVGIAATGRLPSGLLGPVFIGYVPSLITALLFIGVAGLVRMTWLLVRDNRGFLRSLGSANRRAFVKRAFLLWYPMLLFFIVMGGLWWGVANLWIKPELETRIASRTDALLVEIADWTGEQELFLRREFAERHMGFPKEDALLEMAKAPRENWITEGLAFESALERALREFNELQAGFANVRMQYGVLRGRDRAWTNVAALPNEVGNEIDTAIPEEDLPLMEGPEFCWFWQFGCQAEQFIAETTNELMVETRQSIRDGAVDGVRQAVEAGETNMDKIADDTVTRVGAMHGSYAETTTASLGTGFQTWRNISVLATVYSFIVLAKSYFVVLSRVIFSPKSETPITAEFLPHPAPDGAGGIARHGQLLRIPADATEAHFVARWGVTLEGPPPARRRPLGLRFPIARILSGTWVMNRIDAGRDAEAHEYDADLKVDEPAELVTWQLREGERAVFHFRDFVGMSESIRVRRVASLSITTLILGRMIYHVAEGPGLIILRTTAAARITPETEAARPAPMPKLVAWGAGTRFGILAAQTTIDTFLSGYNLRTEPEDAVVWDSSTRRGDGPGTGILTFAKSFLLPI